MLRMTFAASSALAGSGVSAPVSALPLVATSTFRWASLQPSTSYSCSSSSCRPLSTVDSSRHASALAGAHHNRGTRAAATPAAATLAAAVPATHRPDSAPTLCDPSAYQSLSLLILLHECTRRVYGRPLLECSDPLALGSQLDSLPCCVVLLAPPPPPRTPPPLQPPPPPRRTSREVEIPAAAAATSTWQDGGGSTDCSRSSTTSSSNSSSIEDGGFDGSGSVRVQYLNRAAAEAIKTCGSLGGVSGSGSSSGSSGAMPRGISWPLFAAPDEGRAAALLRELMAAWGPPRAGQLHSLSLRTGPVGATQSSGASAHRDSGSAATAGGGGEQQATRVIAGGGSGAQGAADAPSGSSSPSSSIICPEALLLPLMSPSGCCAGVALLFDRWQLRTAASPGAHQHLQQHLQPQHPQPSGQPRQHPDGQQQQQQQQQQDQQIRPHQRDLGDAGSSEAAVGLLREGRPLVPELPYGAVVPREEALAALREAVRGRADAVRALKAQQGLANTDPRVTSAVAELQRLKAELELQQRLAAAFAEDNEGVVRQLIAGAPAVAKLE